VTLSYVSVYGCKRACVCVTLCMYVRMCGAATLNMTSLSIFLSLSLTQSLDLNMPGAPPRKNYFAVDSVCYVRRFMCDVSRRCTARPHANPHPQPHPPRLPPRPSSPLNDVFCCWVLFRSGASCTCVCVSVCVCVCNMYVYTHNIDLCI
jgi:hypothetical protein